MKITPHHALLWVLSASMLGCSADPVTVKQPVPVTQANHTAFPITAGTTHEFGKTTAEGAITCDSCHRPSADSFAVVRCDGCHRHPDTVTPRLHLAVSDFAVDLSGVTDVDQQADLRGASCYRCHPTGEPRAFSHSGVTDACAQCHAVGTSFAALPLAGFSHLDFGQADCGGCHVTTSWKGASAAPNGSSDRSKDLALTGLMPSFQGTTIVRVTPQPQTLKMPMNHQTVTVDAGVLTTCGACHQDANTGVYLPGLFHSALLNLSLPPPTRCNECHGTLSVPVGFVGPMVAGRVPATGGMRHDAVIWVNGAPTITPMVTQDCAVCHQAPNDTTSAWTVGLDGGAVLFHAPLAAAGQAALSSCIDCHANSRPTLPLTSAAAAVPPGMTFDHTAGAAGTDNCAGCHASTRAWSGGVYHQPGAAAPASCLPCHGAERPTTNAAWSSTTYTKSPFDYGTNDAGITHGDGDDCASCHGTTTQTWKGGAFPHGAGTLAATTCRDCHISQRPSVVVQSFDHTGTGDCRACHQATVTAGRYVDYVNPSTMTLPGGDWQGAAAYPGDVPAASTASVTLTQWSLTRNSSNLVTGLTSTSSTFHNAMVHTSTAVPSVIQPGPASAPVNATCWHCHTNTNGTVTTYSNGKFHSALDAYASMAGGTPTGLPQPTAQCKDCHEQMRPNLIVEKGASVLVPMDHSATFTGAVTLGGQSVTGVGSLDCSLCHHTPGQTWADGLFHANIGAAVPSDCVSCHYPLMATAAADTSAGTSYAMKHRSTQLPSQKCDTCHPTALSAATATPVATRWQTGALHAHLSPQPTACLECHGSSQPTASTQGTVTYTLALGGTTTNGAQWMNHAMADVTGKDCVTCHAADAPSATAFNRATNLHAFITNPSGCAPCHGTTNGQGTVIGTNNNLPTGLTNSTTTTTASPYPGVKDQLSHADVNVTGHDCNFCHTQKGPSTVAGVQGKEWAQASFHKNFTTALPLVLNQTTGRCSNCHYGLKPGTTFTTYDHSGVTNTSGSQDCSACHSYPGTSTTTPNWLGAVGGAPTTITVGGFTIPMPPAKTAGTTQAGIASLPHPTVGTTACSVCHTGGVGGRHAIAYDHASTLINSHCDACHEAGTDLLGTVWNGATTTASGAGDSRPFTLTSVVPSFKGNSRACAYPNHFAGIDCKECHTIPTGTAKVTTGTSYTTAWKLKHTTSNMTNPGTCNTCHGSASSGGCGLSK
jgi:hypothetical protein